VRKFIWQLLIILLFASKPCTAQIIDSLAGLTIPPQLPGKYYTEVDKKISSINEQLTKKSLKYLEKFQRQETKIQRKLEKLNPGMIAENASAKYRELFQKVSSKSLDVSNTSITGEYNSNLDSLGTSLSFLKQFNGICDRVKVPLESFNQLQNKLQQSENIKAFIAERRNQISY